MDQIQSVKQRFGIIGNSSSLNYALSIALRVAPTNLSVLINGESGVGKEVFSQIIHGLSPRKHNPFIAVNCGAIPEGTIDSELFGHEKGSFTGAHDARKGYFETVSSGTIFLDEIGEMPQSTQARLLRVLETGEFIRVGSSKVIKTDVRVVAATNVDLLSAVQEGKFREDLYYRLNTVPLKIPSLRERSEDIYLLFRKFAVDFADKYRTQPIKLDEDAIHALATYKWPGNIRELKNLAEQLSVLVTDREISLDDLKTYVPHIDKGGALVRSSIQSDNADVSEREILFKFLMEMRKDLNDLKQFVLERTGADEIKHKGNFESYADLREKLSEMEDYEEEHDNVRPIILNESDEVEGEIIDESLSIADKEKELINKALKKHKGRRKNAALDLGISERTLYRKIKEYDIIEQ